jgi:hypothetical protein
MELDKKIEKKIKEQTFQFLKNTRPNWNKRHTLTSVKWMRELIKTEGGDEKILVPAIYLHDIGYDELPRGYSLKFIMKRKKEADHGKIGSLIAAKYLPKLNYFSDKEINKIVYLIKNHNKHNNIKSKDRQLVFEADSFAQIDYNECPPGFDYKNTKIFLDTIFKERAKLIKTKTGKKILNNLLPQAKEYLKNLK